MSYRVGIDLGGTNIVAGVVDQDYNIIAKASCKTNVPRPEADVCDSMAAVVKEAIKKAKLKMDDIDYIGIGVPGAVNPETRIIETSPNLFFKNWEIAKMMEERLHKYTKVENDANAAALGEFLAGSAKGTKNAIAITLGTGVGGGIIIDGKIYSGSNYAGAELGHMVIVKDGRECGCGRKGCWEAYASATALINMTKAAIRNEKAIYKGTVVSTVFALVVAGGCYFLGGFGRLFSDQIDIAANGFDSVIPTMLSGLGDFLIAVVLILVLSASMSTLSSLVLTSSSTLTLDFINSFRKKDASEKQNLVVLRLFVAIFILISAVIAIVQAKSRVTFIAQLMGISWGALSGSFLAPFFYGLYWKKVTKPAVAVSFIFGTLLMVIQLLISMKLIAVSGPVLTLIFKNSLYSGVFSMLSSLIIVPLVSAFTQKGVPSDVDKMFDCYNTTVMVPAREILIDSEEGK